MTASSERTEPNPGANGAGRTALIADDVPDNRALLRKIVEARGFTVAEASDGGQVVDLVRDCRPDLILLDARMPNMNGLDTLREIRDGFPHVPVVVTTTTDDPDFGEQALRLGAVNFIRSPFDPVEVEFVIDRLTEALSEVEEAREALPLIRHRSTSAELASDLSRIGPLVTFLGRELRHHYFGRDARETEVKLALHEALANAIEHGNLEISFDDKTRALEDRVGLHDLIRQRAQQEPYASRRVTVTVTYEPTRAVYAICDQGPGFDVAAATQPPGTVDATTTALHGRGLLLIRHYVDHVEWNETGNEIRLTILITDAP